MKRVFMAVVLSGSLVLGTATMGLAVTATSNGHGSGVAATAGKRTTSADGESNAIAGGRVTGSDFRSDAIAGCRGGITGDV